MNSTLGSGHEVYNEYARRLIRTKARHLSRRADFCRSDEEDIAQDLTLHLLGQASQFDPTRANVNTFVSLVIDSGVRILLRMRGRMQRKPNNGEIQTLETTVDVPEGPPAWLAKLISLADVERRTGASSKTELEAWEEREALNHAMRHLPANLRRACQWLMTEPPARAARGLGISRRQLRGWMKTIREHFTNLELGRD